MSRLMLGERTAEQANPHPIAKQLKKRLTTLLEVPKSPTSKEVKSKTPTLTLRAQSLEDQFIHKPIPGSEYIERLINAYDHVLKHLGDRVDGNIRNTQDCMLLAYKQRFYEVRKEMEELKLEIAEERQKLNRDKRILSLEEERDWYRDELEKTETRLRKLETSHEKLKAEYQEAVADRKLLREQLYWVKKENKELYVQKTGAGITLKSPHISVLDRSLKTAEGGLNRAFKLVTPLTTVQKSFQTVDSVKEQIKIEPTLETPEHVDAVSSLRKRLATEQKKVRELTREKVEAKNNEAELRELFVDCVETVKRDIEMRQIKKDSAKVSLASFLSGDKRKVMELMFENDEFVDGIARILFPQCLLGKGSTMLTEFLAKAQEKKKTKSIADLMRIGRRKKQKRMYTTYKSINKPLTYL